MTSLPPAGQIADQQEISHLSQVKLWRWELLGGSRRGGMPGCVNTEFKFDVILTPELWCTLYEGSVGKVFWWRNEYLQY